MLGFVFSNKLLRLADPYVLSVLSSVIDAGLVPSHHTITSRKRGGWGHGGALFAMAPLYTRILLPCPIPFQ
jgi:hypothetical protein